MKFVRQTFNQIQQHFFSSVTEERLVYNACWEDPRMDRVLLHLKPDSRVVMITSAGCNALDYLLDTPARIHCVDVNPAQNAVLELKKVLFQYQPHKLLWEMFGTGCAPDAAQAYRQFLREELSTEARNFWDHHIDYFSPRNPRGSFYYNGSAGTIAYGLCRFIERRRQGGAIQKLLDAPTLDEQRYYFERIMPDIWTNASRWLMQLPGILAMLGVPRSQQDLIRTHTEAGLAAFIHQSIEEVFTRRPINDNYFWRVYLTGAYTRECCPNYLKQTSQNTIRNQINTLSIHTTSITRFLQDNPGSYTHFVLLDHQDWLLSEHPSVLANEWRLLMDNMAPGARVLFRTAGKTREFLPPFVNEAFTFDDAKTRRLHQQDRVGTYGSTHLGILQ